MDSNSVAHNLTKLFFFPDLDCVLCCNISSLYFQEMWKRDLVTLLLVLNEIWFIKKMNQVVYLLLLLLLLLLLGCTNLIQFDPNSTH